MKIYTLRTTAIDAMSMYTKIKHHIASKSFILHITNTLPAARAIITFLIRSRCLLHGLCQYSIPRATMSLGIRVARLRTVECLKCHKSNQTSSIYDLILLISLSFMFENVLMSKSIWWIRFGSFFI